MHSAHRLYEAKCIGHILSAAPIVNDMFDLDRFIADCRDALASIAPPAAVTALDAGHARGASVRRRARQARAC